MPENLHGQKAYNVTVTLDCESSNIGLYIAIPIIIILVVIIILIIVKICVNKKRTQKKKVRYSAVYKDTVTKSQPQETEAKLVPDAWTKPQSDETPQDLSWNFKVFFDQVVFLLTKYLLIYAPQK